MCVLSLAVITARSEYGDGAYSDELTAVPYLASARSTPKATASSAFSRFVVSNTCSCNTYTTITNTVRVHSCDHTEYCMSTQMMDYRTLCECTVVTTWNTV